MLANSSKVKSANAFSAILKVAEASALCSAIFAAFSLNTTKRCSFSFGSSAWDSQERKREGLDQKERPFSGLKEGIHTDGSMKEIEEGRNNNRKDKGRDETEDRSDETYWRNPCCRMSSIAQKLPQEKSAHQQGIGW